MSIIPEIVVVKISGLSNLHRQRIWHNGASPVMDRSGVLPS